MGFHIKDLTLPIPKLAFIILVSIVFVLWKIGSKWGQEFKVGILGQVGYHIKELGERIAIPIFLASFGSFTFYIHVSVQINWH